MDSYTGLLKKLDENKSLSREAKQDIVTSYMQNEVYIFLNNALDTDVIKSSLGVK